MIDPVLMTWILLSFCSFLAVLWLALNDHMPDTMTECITCILLVVLSLPWLALLVLIAHTRRK